MDSSVTQRIKLVIQWLILQGYAINQEDLGRKMGIANKSYLSQLISGKANNEEFINKLSSFDSRINFDWLLTGEGEMLKTATDIKENIAEASESDTTIYTVPLLPISAQGGSFNDFVESIKENDCERIISPVKAVDLAITVSGDSMAPEFPNGCQVLIKKINEDAFIEWGKVYVLDTCNGTVIKEIHKGQNDDEIECFSINPNPKFQPFSVKREDIYGMYRVIMCMSLK